MNAKRYGRSVVGAVAAGAIALAVAATGAGPAAAGPVVVPEIEELDSGRVVRPFALRRATEAGVGPHRVESYLMGRIGVTADVC